MPSAAAKTPASPAPAKRGLLELRCVSKVFRNSPTAAIQCIDLCCQPGEFVVVVGPSGCGKSTLLNIAAGLIAADNGGAWIDGRKIELPGPDRAMVFQEHGLFPWLTAEENIEFGLKMKGMPRAERADRVQRALRMVHLPDAGRKLVHELSGGMRQRVAIARALVMDPDVLLMDEPFSSLDAQTRTLLHEQLQEIWLANSKTVLFVTHSVGEAVRLADRVVIMHANPGRIRREVPVKIPHPRDFDSPDISEVVGVIRTEIEDEVNRIHAETAEQVSHA
ncbi:MAG: ABC transporter ATP-binding protein [Planctomycetes bacterium]|nr:ABC transporter ATP-binding protein [Planctomycetota bacterium]